MGKIRLAAADCLEENELMPRRSNNEYKFLWVVDFPMFTKSDTGTELESTHHPFTAPHPDDANLLEHPKCYEEIRSQAYDLVLNGQEIGGGSIRIHDATTQEKVLADILKIDHSHLGHLIDALASGCPPHGGIALGIRRYPHNCFFLNHNCFFLFFLGLDRLLSILCNTNSIRDVIAFPKGVDGKDHLSKAPVPLSTEELQMYNISVQSE